MLFLQHPIALAVLESNRLFTIRHENGFLDVRQMAAGQELFVLQCSIHVKN
jgi:hypothetical protein